MELDLGIAPTPESFEILFNSKAEIIVFSGTDSYFHLRHRLGLEFDDVPFKNPSLAQDTAGYQDLTQEITLIYITGFFTDVIDFALYVKGLKNMTSLSKGTFGAKCYDGPCFATPVIGFDHKEIFKGAMIKSSTFEYVSRTETKGLRWRYYYETARTAYAKLEFDWDKFMEQQRQRNDTTGDRASMPPETYALSDTPSRSPTPPEDYSLTPSDEMEDVGEGDYDYEEENGVSVEVKEVNEVEDHEAEMDRGMDGLELESKVD